jgi:hypothetical protein
MSTRDREERLAAIMKQWEAIELKTIGQTAAIQTRTHNRLIQLVMTIIQHDSAMHHRTQQFIADSLEREFTTVSVDDLTAVWDAIEEHIEAEKQVAQLARQAQEALAGTKNVVQQYLLSYLRRDEEKHDHLLEDLALIKKGMYRSA